MGVLSAVFLFFLSALMILFVAVKRRNKLLKILSLGLFVVSVILFLLVMRALGMGS